MSATPPPGFRLRQVSVEDAAMIAELVNATWVGEIGVPGTSVVETRDELREPGRELAADNALVVTDDGRPAGYLDLTSVPPFTDIHADGYVHPGFWGRGLGSYLIELGEERGRNKARRAPPGERAVVRVARWTTNRVAQRLFEEHGYRFVRRFWWMRADLDAPPPPPRFPPKVQLRPFERERDELAVHAALSEAFRDHWGHVFPPFDRWVHGSIEGEGAGFDPALWFVAVEGEEVAGAALCRVGTAWDEQMGSVEDLAVRPAWRRRGIGLALLLAAFGEFRRLGTHRVGLAVDSENPTGAIRLYERAGMHVEREWESWEKEIRPS